jgi:hypothetical protein
MIVKRTVVSELKRMKMTIPKIPTYAEVASKLAELEVKYEILGNRYDTLTALLRKQGKDNVVFKPEFGKLGTVWDDEKEGM